jgi:hypothetical protein
MIWLRPTPTFINSAWSQTSELIRDMDPRSILFDAEHAWNGYNGALTSAYTLAVATVRSTFGTATSSSGRVLLGVTDVATISNPFPPKLLALACDYVMPQAYSVVGATDAETRRRAPGTFQRLAHDRWQAPRKPMVMALANYGDLQPPPGSLSATPAVATDYVAGKVSNLGAGISPFGVDEIAFWGFIGHIAELINIQSLPPAAAARRQQALDAMIDAVGSESRMARFSVPFAGNVPIYFL